MAMDLWEYLRLRCSQMLLLERSLLQLNGHMMSRSEQQRLHEILRWHTGHLEEQQSNLQTVLDNIGGFTGPQENPLAKGLSETYQLLVGLNPQAQVMDIELIQMLDMISEMKIGLYRGLIDMAHLLGAGSAVERLELSQADEERMRSRIEDWMLPVMTDLMGRLRKAA